MSVKNVSSVISILPVQNFEQALTWYQTLMGRTPDIVPMEGIAEWQIVENAWIQVSFDPERAGQTTVVLCVDNLAAQYQRCIDANLAIGEIVEYPEIIKMAEVNDPEGNKLSFVEDISTK
ncbi:VOC family protein [Catenovulum sp. SM1970]|uniref:VOC family protein n=1 Tax=Marinifaba aquimaris TaxID=2741323 RepID=UPI001574C4AA|nr:VOC family protein [Marinifaba aquimaris]NTS78484.1 VOC family protein [Marinifaba aquimaris]